MSFSGIETSEYGGELVMYFEFTVGATVYRYNSSARTLTLSGHGFAAHPIALSEPEHAKESSSMRVRITVPRDNPIALLFRQALPDVQVPVTVYAKHQGDAEVVGAWSGTIVSCEWRESEAAMVCETNLAKMKRLGLRQRYQVTCNKETYSAECGVNREDFKTAVIVSAINALVLTVSGLPSVADGYYNGGYVQSTDGTRRFITDHTGNHFTLLYPFETLAVSDSLDAFAGDDHTHETCREKFNNIANFFGFFTLPGRNPFTQGGLPVGEARGSGIVPR